MCGIALCYSPVRVGQNETETIRRMNALQRHRGPDDEGISVHAHCILGHVRLAIIDLTDAGHQPFVSTDGRFELVYNGEIYNYIELRYELTALGWQFHTQTDTEVLLTAWQQFGPSCLDKLNGMFAFAVYDTIENMLFFARDRFGIKPLYYTHMGHHWYFASEIKTFLAIPDFQRTLNYQALFEFLVFNRTDIGESTFLEEINRLPKGHYALLNNEELTLRQWWKPSSQNTEFQPLQSLYESIDETMTSSVALRLRSDVPMGTCLSGGLDSSIITGIVHEHHAVETDFATFTAAFPGYPFDETNYIDALNRKYHFRNIRTMPLAEKCLDNFAAFVRCQDEPTPSPSYFAQYEVMRLAREHGITVMLDGQGGDENFAGHQYMHAYHLLGLLYARRWDKAFHEGWNILRRKQEWLTWQTFLYGLLPNSLKKQSIRATRPFISADFFQHHIGLSPVYNQFLNARSLNDSIVQHFKHKLEHLLRAEDRNSMAFSIEARVPYLDYRLVELLLNIPESLKIHAGETKRLQKQALGKYTVPEILNRTDKVGFATPVREWMQTPIWQAHTQRSADFLHNRLPDVFPTIRLATLNPIDCWKLNQVAEWITIFIDEKKTDNSNLRPVVRSEAEVKIGANRPA
ncbi:asparagine synthase (glutamine-hydrolyzing) [candidate division KSB1 bacterium]|nr:asparagine synthase (glutamine-hydrolyzing) [candidate division KSB1 bacterium]